jgi:hypothetical protein
MSTPDWIKVHSEMSQVFEHGDITQASPEDLQRYLQVCCSGSIPNTTVHPREIIRGITINNVQMGRVICKLEETIERLNAENSKKDKWIMILAIASLIATAAGIFF